MPRATISACALLLSSGAPAQESAREPAQEMVQAPAPAWLSYQRGPGAEACPDERSLRQAVSARLGDDAFVEGAARALSVTIAARRGGLTAVVRLTDGGREVGRRELGSPAADCRELASALVLAMSLALDPLLLNRPVPPVASDPSPPAPVEIPPPPSPESKTVVVHEAPPRTSRGPPAPEAWLIGVDAVGSAGTAPSLAVGLALNGEARWMRFSLGLEGRADLPSSAAYEGGQLSAALLVATVAPCYRLSFFGVCALVSAGAQQVAGTGYVSPANILRPYVALGGRLVAELPLGSRVAIRIAADLRAPLTQQTLLVNGAPAWVTPLVAGSLLLGPALRL